MSEDRRALGARGEAAAAEHLVRAGYRIIGRNVRAGGVEIDLIARRGRLLIFVEVKTRRSRRQGPPEEGLSRRQRARIVRGAAAWLHEHRAQALRVRFDVVAIECHRDENLSVVHWKGAFDASRD